MRINWDYIPRPYVSVQKCHNAPICGLFAKPANFIFKFLSLKISLIQTDCHRKQVLIVRSTRFHGLEQSLEILPERDSDLLASLDKSQVIVEIHVADIPHSQAHSS